MYAVRVKMFAIIANWVSENGTEVSKMEGRVKRIDTLTESIMKMLSTQYCLGCSLLEEECE